MALVYKRSTKNAARRYERSTGMEPNPGVSALTVVNPGRPPSRNPFQWISGHGQRHVHQSREYETLDAAKRWKGRAKETGARLYPVDERGTIVSRPISASLLQNSSRRNEMAYNIGALRRAMKANMSPEDWEVIKQRARSVDTGGASARSTAASSAYLGEEIPDRPKRRVSPTAEATSPRRRGQGGARPRASRATRSSGAGTKARVSRSGASLSARGRRTSRRGGKRRASKKKKHSLKKSYFRSHQVRLTGREYVDKYLLHGVLPAVTRLGRSGFSRSGRPYVLTYPIPSRGYGRLSKKRVSVRGGGRRGYAVGATYRGRRARRMLEPGKRRRRRSKAALAANRRRSRRAASRRGSRRGSRRASRRASRRRVSRNPHYVVVNRRRRSRRGSRRASRGLYANKGRRRRSRRASRRSVMSLYANKGRRRSRRGSKRASRRGSRRGSRRSSRRASLRPNMLAVSKVRWQGRGAARVGKPLGRSYQLVEFGPKSGRKYRKAGYPVMVPPSVSLHSYVRKFRFGGAAKDAHTRAVSSGYRERKKYARSRKLGKNRRRTSMRRNPKYVVVNRRGRRSRRVHKNFLGRIDWMGDVVTPVAAGTAGFVAARVLSNSLANVGALRNALDSGASAADAKNTKLAANAVGIVATLGLATQVPMVRKYQGALVTGMGLALADRLIQRFGGETAANYLSGFGEYVNQPLNGFGEYVNQPLSGGFGEYVNQPLSGGIGEYVNQPLNGLGTMYATAGYPEGIDPSDQGGTDGLMDTMEAAAGVGAFEAAAGVGTMYATAGLGATMGEGEADASLAKMYAKMQPPFTSIQTPTDLARDVTKEFPYDKPVKESLTTPEGKGYAGGLFSRHLFAGMMGS